MRRDSGSTTRHSSGMGLTAQAARRMMIVLTILGLVTLSLGVGFTLVQRAGATTDVCPIGCTYSSIQSAISAASSGSTITVGPGTYNEVLNINKSLTLVGPNVGINGASGSRGAEAVIDATGKGPIAVTISAPNVTINGFTITGAHGNSSHIASEGITGPSGVDGLLITNNIIRDNYNGIFELGGTNISVTQNLIQDNSAKQFGDSCFGGAPYCNGIFVGANFTSLVITNNTIDESITLPTDFSNHFQRSLSINPSSQGNVTIENNTLFNSSTLGNVTGDFASNSDTGGTFAVRLVGGVNNFSINNNSFTGLFTSAVASQNSYNSAGNSNLTIHDNTVTQDVGVLQPGWLYASLDVATFDLDTLHGSNSISGNTVNYFGTYSLSGTAVEAIHIRSGMTGSLSITGNSFNGGKVGGTDTEGVLLDSGATPPSLTGNLIRSFTNGVNDVSSSTYTLGQNNCISGNSSYGFTAIGGSVNAQHNWWGAAAGPGAGVGFGNPVTTSTVDASNFLTSAPQSACAGPVASNVQTNSNPLPVNSAYTLTAKLDTSTTSNAPVASAYYTLDGGAPVAMTTTSGTFGSSTLVQVTSGSLSAFSVVGTHTLCVFGTDSYGQTGSPVCMQLSVIIPSVNTTTTIPSSANPSTFNQSVTITITVASGSGTPTGDVTLKDGATTLTGPVALASGMATFITSALTVGTHPLVALYAGDSTGNPIFQPSTSATFNQVVNTIPTTTSVTASPNPSVSGQNVTFSVTVHAADGSTPTGSVTLTDGATQLGVVTLTNGAGSFSTSALSVGAHNIAAAYGGDTTHSVSNGSATATVTATPAVPTGSSNAYIRIVQSSEAYATSDISIDGSVTFPNVAACTAQPYYPITAGAHTFTVASPSGGSTVITQSLTLTAGAYYTLAVVGNSAKSITPALLVFQDNNTVSSNQAKVRVSISPTRWEPCRSPAAAQWAPRAWPSRMRRATPTRRLVP